MNYSDYIKMTQIGVYSITFPTDKLIETLESATLEARNGVEFEVLKNPITGKKVHIGYIGDQYEALNRIIRSTLLEFTQETKLKTFA